VQGAERVRDGNVLIVMGMLFKFMTPELETIKDVRLVHVKKGCDQICAFAQDFNTYLLDNGNSSYYIACYINPEKIAPGVCNHFYEGWTDERDNTWLLTIEAMLYDPNPDKTRAEE